MLVACCLEHEKYSPYQHHMGSAKYKRDESSFSTKQNLGSETGSGGSRSWGLLTSRLVDTPTQQNHPQIQGRLPAGRSWRRPGQGRSTSGPR